MSNNAATATENKKRKEAFSLWEKISKKDNVTKYLSGSNGIVGFYNTQKKSMKEADITLYQRLDDGSRIVLGNLYSQVGKTGKPYLSGNVSGKDVVGFYGKPDRSPKAPLISLYYKDEYVEDTAAPQDDELPINEG